MSPWIHVDEKGSVSLMLAVLGLALIAVVGLVVDGGGKARALARADDAAAAAARCGTQAVDLDAAREGQARVNATAAASRVRSCLRSAGMTGDVTISDGGRRLHVTADVAYRPVFLSAVGVPTSTVSGEATVDLVEVQQGAIR
jgi:Flp pilus assembly protein TadG